MTTLGFTGTSQDCGCENCVGACRTKPGIFAPGEVEKVAEFLQIDLPTLFDTRLGVDWWENDDGQSTVIGTEPQVYYLAPAVVGAQAGHEYPSEPRGRCVFLTSEHKCAIHSVKPAECRFSYHDNSRDVHWAFKEQIVEKWVPKQDQIRRLLGREPQRTTSLSSWTWGWRA